MREKTAVQTLGLAVLSGIPVYLEGPPGDGKTSLKRAVLEKYGYKPIELVAADLSPERVAGYPVPVLEKGAVRYVPDELLARVREGGYGLVISEINTAPPETISAVLEMVRVGRVAGEANVLPILMSANPENQAVASTPLGPAFANRILYLQYQGERAAQEWVMRRAARIAEEAASGKLSLAGKSPRELFDAVESLAWRAYLDEILDLPPSPGVEDIPDLLMAQAEARNLAADFLQSNRPAYESPPDDLREAFRPFFTRRSFAMATNFLATYLWATRRGWKGGVEPLLLGLKGIVGEGVGVPFASYVEARKKAPTPEEILRNPRLFPTRPDEASAAGAAIVALLRQKGDYEAGLSLAEALAKEGRVEDAFRFLATLTKAAKKAGVKLPIPKWAMEVLPRP